MNKPSSCPNCEKRNLAFITEYHKCIWGQSAKMFLIIVFAMLIIGNINNIDTLIGLSLLAAMVFCSLQAYISYVESKTHVQCICKDCGYVWLHDNLY